MSALVGEASDAPLSPKLTVQIGPAKGKTVIKLCEMQGSVS
ncbi:hypothetical protein DT23_03540 [Thioclava indica]|uniref:Uncharacterized protein n=1 Tax=Thioclava indica TaxID=1353528 RepID=A0A074JSH1_9RHOB|nr:hypothetical protein DT23_03540 [Thioclava indica]